MYYFTQEQLVSEEQLTVLQQDYDCVTYSFNASLSLLITKLNSVVGIYCLSYSAGTVGAVPTINRPFIEQPHIILTYSKRGYPFIKQFLDRITKFFEQQHEPIFNIRHTYQLMPCLLHGKPSKVRALNVNLTFNSLYIGLDQDDLKYQITNKVEQAWDKLYQELVNMFEQGFVQTFLPIVRTMPENNILAPNVLYKDVAKKKLAFVSQNLKEMMAYESRRTMFGYSLAKSRTALCTSITSTDYYVVSYVERKPTVDYFGYIPNRYGNHVSEVFHLTAKRLGVQFESPDRLSHADNWIRYFGLE